MRISDWSSELCSSDLHSFVEKRPGDVATVPVHQEHPFGNAPFAIAAFETVEIAAAEEELVRNAGDFVPIELRGIAGAERLLHLCAIALQHANGEHIAFALRDNSFHLDRHVAARVHRVFKALFRSADDISCEYGRVAMYNHAIFD